MGLRLRRFRTIFVLLAVAASLPVMVFMGVSLVSINRAGTGSH